MFFLISFLHQCFQFDEKKIVFVNFDKKTRYFNCNKWNIIDFEINEIFKTFDHINLKNLNFVTSTYEIQFFIFLLSKQIHNFITFDVSIIMSKIMFDEIENEIRFFRRIQKKLFKKTTNKNFINFVWINFQKSISYWIDKNEKVKILTNKKNFIYENKIRFIELIKKNFFIKKKQQIFKTKLNLKIKNIRQKKWIYCKLLQTRRYHVKKYRR